MSKFSRFSVLTAVSGLMLAGIAYAVSTPRPASKSVASKATPPAVSIQSEFNSLTPTKAQSGPWGDLEWTTTYIEAPNDILDGLRKPDATPHWVFPDGTEASLRALFNRAGLAADVQQHLFDPKRVLIQGNTLTLFPQPADLEALKPQTREIIYAELAKWPVNEYYYSPVIIAGSLEDWLRDTKLRPQLQDVIRKVCYRRGNALAFSDLRVLFDYAVSDSEIEHIFKTITRTRTLVGELKLSPGSDIGQLLSYWTGGQPDSEIRPILEAAGARTGGSTIDIMHLLPPLARRRLYTFPTTDLIARGRYPDAHWTSFNFFTNSPQDPNLDLRPDDNHLLESYDQVKPPYRLGDLLCLLSAKGEIAHECVYIADDVVFTKNGPNSIKPWVLLPLKEVVDYFSQSANGDIKAYRRKWESAVATEAKP